jgi:hypothetical protein
MMNNPFAAILVVVLMIPAFTHAESLPLSTSSGTELGLQISDYRYEEQYNNAFLMSNVGIKLGFAGGYTRAFGNGWYVLGDARVALGEVKYTGSGSKEGNPDVLLDGRLIGGKDFDRGSFLLSPYVGLGYRTLYNDLRGLTSSGSAGYRRSSRYIYLPLGLTHRFRVTTEARISTSLEYNHLLEGRQQSFLSDSNFQSNDPVNTQRNGYGIRLVSSYETVSWSLGLFYQFWSLKDSDRVVLTTSGVPVGSVIEPQNTTTEFGVQLKYRFN